MHKAAEQSGAFGFMPVKSGEVRCRKRSWRLTIKFMSVITYDATGIRTNVTSWSACVGRSPF